MPTHLSLNEWNQHLDQTPPLKKKWESLIKQSNQAPALFDILTKHKYNNFDKIQVFNWDTGALETTNHYQDKRLRRAIIQVKELRSAKYLSSSTIKNMISMIQEIQALESVLHPWHPQHPPSPDHYSSPTTVEEPEWVAIHRAICGDRDED